jgi:hypothetical protein
MWKDDDDVKYGGIPSQAPHVNATLEILVKTMVAVKKMQWGIITVSVKEDLQVLSYIIYSIYIMIVFPLCA